jgi:protein involved in polysaccharide export with SLBB domain
MRYLVVLLLFLLLMFPFSSSFAAQDDDSTAFSSNDQPERSSQDYPDDQGESSALGEHGNSRSARGDSSKHSDLGEKPGGDLSDRSAARSKEQGQRVGEQLPGDDAEASFKLRLRGEPGDGEVSLSWYLPEQPEKNPVRFVISYHSDLDKVERKQDQIKGSPYRLRGLKNGQTYYIRVAGYGKNGREVASSQEVTLTPLSPDELGSQIERSFSRSLATMPSKSDGEGSPRDIKQFGYDFFNNSAPASQDNLPVGSDYVIGPGDSLRIDIWGSLQGRHNLVVDRNGEITIPRVGAVKVWGLSYAQLRSVIDKAVSRYFRGYDLNVTLGKLRSIQVFVVGEVHAPGTYTVSSVATAINALAAAGGPSRNGSLRQIRLLREGKTVQEIDLYAMFLSGDRSRDIRVQNGDTLFVPVIGPVAAVAGEVKRPAIYELKGASTLPSMIEMAGGITAAGDKGRIQVERLEGNSSRVVIDYLPKRGDVEQELARVAIQDHDMVKIFPFYDETRHVVSLKGNVAIPGEYQYREGMRLKDLIPGYPALLPETYLGAVEITRLQLPDRHLEKLSANLGKALAGDAKENLELRDQDVVRVFSQWQMQEHPVVAVAGQVVKPGRYPYYPQMTVRDLITASGSLKRNALLGHAELTRIDVKEGGAVSSRRSLDLQKVLAGDSAENLVLQPDDMLIVRSITQWLEAGDRFVTLKGEVNYPGTYSIAKGERLSSVITRAGGFTQRAYLRGGRLTRKSVREMQQKRMDEVIARGEQDILKKQSELASMSSSGEDLAATKSALDGLLKSLQALKSKKAEGRIVLTLLPPEQLAKTNDDIELMGGDLLDVPITPSVVSVLGEVYNPTTFVYRKGEPVSDYLRSAGGPLQDADPSEMYIIRADGTVSSRQQSSFGFSWDEGDKRWHVGSFNSRPMYPGDTVVVPQKLDRIAWLREIKDLTTIVSQVALTAGTVFLFFR